MRIPVESNYTIMGQPKQKRRYNDVNQHYIRNAEIFYGYDSRQTTLDLLDPQRNAPPAVKHLQVSPYVT